MNDNHCTVCKRRTEESSGTNIELFNHGLGPYCKKIHRLCCRCIQSIPLIISENPKENDQVWAKYCPDCQKIVDPTSQCSTFHIFDREINPSTLPYISFCLIFILLIILVIAYIYK